MSDRAHFFRIAQEAVHNAVRHGGARRIRISLDETAEATTLAVRDDGCGIAEDATSKRGTGLISMERRARIMGGSLAIRRHPTAGRSSRAA